MHDPKGKGAVVTGASGIGLGIAEALEDDLAGTNIGVSVLCPGAGRYFASPASLDARARARVES
ncbi:MAG: hypothetical protein U1F14_02165 [Steroidobacteraceae bacterium]